LHVWSRWLYQKNFRFWNTNVIALDRDIESAKIANQLKENFEDRFIFKNIKFSQLSNLKLKNENIKGVIFDLGYSYTQIKDPQKGLSFSDSGKLNMQLGLNSYSAEDVINKLDEKELEKIFKFFGDEKEAKFIARNIIKERSKNQIDTKSLVEIIDKSKKRKNFDKQIINKFRKIQLPLDYKRKKSNFIIKNNFTNKFIKKITENKVSSFKSIEPDLEEIFLSFYKKRGKGVK